MEAHSEWEYYVANCFYKVTKQKIMGIGADEGHWTIKFGDQEYGLSDGLAEFGRRGWELVTVHPTRLPIGGGTSVSWERPSCFYLFKRICNRG